MSMCGRRSFRAAGPEAVRAGRSRGWGMRCAVPMSHEAFPGEEKTINQAQSMRRGLLALGTGAMASLIAMPGALHAASELVRDAGEQAEPMALQDVRPGVAIAYQDEWFGPQWQDGEPILLLHGVPESHLAWQQWVPVLSTRFRVIRPDLRGFGRSPPPAGYECTTQVVAADIVRFADALKIDRFHLVGAKIGGSTAL